MIWNVKKEDTVEFFDVNLSYEITGYRPINKEQGLDFNPDWFRGPALAKLATGKYTQFPRKTKGWREFWDAEIEKIRFGMESNGYRVTGTHYFLLNYFNMPIMVKNRFGLYEPEESFPYFMVFQYEYFHYLEMCQRLGRDAFLLKSRGIGASEMAAAMGLAVYTVKKASRTLYTAGHQDKLLKGGILSKVYNGMSFLNDNTDGALKHLRQVKDSEMHKRASKKAKDGSEMSSSFKSEIYGIIVDDPQKLRGTRVGLLFYEEAGSYRQLDTAWTQGEALIQVMEQRFGIRVGFGTGGDTGSAVEGMKKLYRDPQAYGILPSRHKFTKDESYILSSFFIPSYKTVVNLSDSRGWVDPEKGKEYYDKLRQVKMSDMNEYLKYCAEYCYNAEEAFSFQGSDIFDQIKIAEQLTRIKVRKEVPKPMRGVLHWVYETGTTIPKGVRFEETNLGNIEVAEFPAENAKEYNNLYVAGIDSIDKGTSDSVVGEGGSSFCILIKKRMYGTSGEMYVCKYKHRPRDIRDAYENALKIMIWYNCKANLEDTKTNIIAYFKNNKQMHRLISRPRINLPSHATNKVSNLIGTSSSIKMIKHGLNLVAAYVQDYCHNIIFEDMLEELSTYTYEDKTRFDIVAAMQMCEIYDEDLTELAPIKVNRFKEAWKDFGYKKVNGVIMKGVIADAQENFNKMFGYGE